MIKEIVDYIEANTSFVTGTDMFVGYQPDSPDQCVCIREFPVTQNWSGMITMRLQVLTRAKDYFTARDDVYVIHNLIKLTGFFITDYLVMFCDIASMPQSIGHDIAGRFEFSGNYLMYLK